MVLFASAMVILLNLASLALVWGSHCKRVFGPQGALISFANFAKLAKSRSNMYSSILLGSPYINVGNPLMFKSSHLLFPVPVQSTEATKRALWPENALVNL